jgi:acetyltransferase
MSVRNLDAVFRPTSVALVGASEREGSLGRILLANVLEHFQGPVLPVNPGATSLLGHKAYRSIEALPEVPDLAILASPPDTVPATVAALADLGTRGVCVITAGFGAGGGPSSLARRQALLDAARPKLVRIVGPNCVGLQLPSVGLNASFASVYPDSGSIALVSQSGAVITAVLDWAKPREIGFSHVVSLGDMIDVDFGDMLDYLAADPATQSILLYIEAVTNARKFISAARAAARSKPVIVVKGGRFAAGAKAAASHTGALAGMDEVYDAVFRRAGMLRVYTLEELFDVVETLSTAKVPQGDSLTILTNGGGLGVLAADELMAEGGHLTQLSSETVQQLDAVLPDTWSHGNPVDIIGDAKGDRYAAALQVLLDQPVTESILIINCPTALASSEEVARSVVATLPASLDRCVLTSWTGEHSAREARQQLQAHGIPTYATPGDAVHAFMQMINYRQNQQMLLEVPPSLPKDFQPQREIAEQVISEVLASGRSWLSEYEAKQVLAAYGIPVVPTELAHSAEEVDQLAEQFGCDLAIKILSPDITHKSDVGGVLLNIRPEEAQAAAAGMLARVKAAQPQAHIDGFTVQPMVRRDGAHELIVGMINDAQFGPVILFGHGGTAVEVLDDKALALPPLNLKLARELITRPRIYRLLQGYRDVPATDIDKLALVLVGLSHLISDLPTIQELDINPLLADAAGVVALDARIRVTSATSQATDRLAIRPYPEELETQVALPDGETFVMRAVVPEDETALQSAFANVPKLVLARFTQIDYDRQMALVLTNPGIPGTQDIYAVVRLLEDPDRISADLLIAVAQPWAGRGMGRALLQAIIAYARTRGIGQINVEVPPEAHELRGLCSTHGFVMQDGEDVMSLYLSDRSKR